MDDEDAQEESPTLGDESVEEEPQPSQVLEEAEATVVGEMDLREEQPADNDGETPLLSEESRAYEQQDITAAPPSQPTRAQAHRDQEQAQQEEVHGGVEDEEDDECRDKPRKVMTHLHLERLRRLALPKERTIQAVLMDMWPVLDHWRLEILKKMLMDDYGLSRREVDQLTEPPREPVGLEASAVQARERMFCNKYLEHLSKHIAYSLISFGKQKHEINRTDDVVWLGNALAKHMREGSEQTKCMVEAVGVTRKERNRKVRLLRKDFAEKLASWILGVASEADEFAEEEEKKRRQQRKEKQRKQPLIREERKQLRTREEKRVEKEKDHDKVKEADEIEGEHLHARVEAFDETEIMHEKEADIRELEILHEKYFISTVQERRHSYERGNVIQVQFAETHTSLPASHHEDELAAEEVVTELEEQDGEHIQKVLFDIPEGLLQVYPEIKLTHSITENPCPIETNRIEYQLIEPRPAKGDYEESPHEKSPELTPEMLLVETDLQEIESELREIVSEDEEIQLIEETSNEHEEEESELIITLHHPPEEVDRIPSELSEEEKQEESEMKDEFTEEIDEKEITLMPEKVVSERIYLVKDQGDMYFVKEIIPRRKSADDGSMLSDVVKILSDMIPTSENGITSGGDSSRREKTSKEQMEESSELAEDDSRHTVNGSEREEDVESESESDGDKDEEHRRKVKKIIASKLTESMLRTQEHIDYSTTIVIDAVSECIENMLNRVLNEAQRQEKCRARPLEALQLAEEWVSWVLEAAETARQRRRSMKDATWERWRRRAAQQARGFLVRRRQLECGPPPAPTS